MLTMMKLTGNPHDVTRYHTQQENYYFKQASRISDTLKDKVDIVDSATLDYVTVEGKLVKDFGLVEGQAISQRDFEMLLSGNFLDGRQCTQKKHRVSGYDFTFSAPKTVSIAGLVVDKDPQLIKCHDNAVRETMREIEEHYSMAHPKDSMEVKSEGILWVAVKDGFSREHDPHLHTHCVVANITKYKNKFMALRTRKMMQRDFNRMWGTYYRMSLARQVRKLGYSISYLKSGEWRIDKISQSCEKEFSTRRQQIVKEKSKGLSEYEAWMKSRKKENAKIDKKEITNHWQKVAEDTNTTTTEENKKQTLEEHKKWIEEAEFNIEAAQERQGRNNATELERWLLAVDRATQKSATASEEGVISEYIAEEMRAGNWDKTLSYEDLKEQLLKQVEIGGIVKVKERYTSLDFMITERKYFNWTEKKNDSFTLKTKEIEKHLKTIAKEKQKQNKKYLSKIQEQSVIDILKNDNYLTIVQGDAGAGKTTLLSVVNDLCNRNEVKVIGLAMQGVAARNLEKESGIKSITVASYLKSEQREESKIIVVDEASMLDSRSAKSLFERAYTEGSKIILVGDQNQLESIQAGRVFSRLVKDAEKNERLVNLNENYRQRDVELRKAVEHARDGEMKQSLDILDKKGSIIVVEDTKIRRDRIAKSYNDDTLIISGTVAGKKELNLLIRDKLISERKIESKGQDYKMCKMNDKGEKQEYDITLSKGELITFAKNEYQNYDIRNGERGRIIELGPNTLTIELEDKRKINLDLDYYNYIDYGYAVTTYKAQGLTFDRVIVETDTRVKGLADMRNQYVNITRARDNVKIYTDDKEDLKELALIKSIKRDTLDENINIEHLELKKYKVNQNIQEQNIKIMKEKNKKIREKGKERILELNY